MKELKQKLEDRRNVLEEVVSSLFNKYREAETEELKEEVVAERLQVKSKLDNVEKALNELELLEDLAQGVVREVLRNEKPDESRRRVTRELNNYSYNALTRWL